jgi:hypothetical protein
VDFSHIPKFEIFGCVTTFFTAGFIPIACCLDEVRPASPIMESLQDDFIANLVGRKFVLEIVAATPVVLWTRSSICRSNQRCNIAFIPFHVLQGSLPLLINPCSCLIHHYNTLAEKVCLS